MAHWPWIERTFHFDFPVGKMPDLLERLRGTPARVTERVAGLSGELLTRGDGQSWSIQENVGHLIDLGYLPLRRLEQIIAGEAVLIAADMKNEKTHLALYNQRDMNDLLGEFRRDRAALVARLESLSQSDWGKSALHPRLAQPMRIVDIVCFDAEHDDYHLARIGSLIRKFTTSQVQANESRTNRA